MFEKNCMNLLVLTYPVLCKKKYLKFGTNAQESVGDTQV